DFARVRNFRHSEKRRGVGEKSPISFGGLMTSIIQTFKSKGASAILDDYRIIRDEADAILEIEGKTIRRALMEQTSWQSYYDQKRGELKSLLKYFNEVVMGPIRGSKWKDLTEESNISLSQKD